MSEQKVPVKTNGKRNKNAGKKWELDIISRLRKLDLYPHAVSTRSESRTLDGFGIDIMNHQEHIRGIMQDSIQAKTETRMVPYAKILDRIRQANRPNPVIFHRQTARSTKGNRFMHRDTFAISYLDDYIKLLQYRKLLHDIMNSVEVNHLPIDIKQQLKELGS